jgi:hypothetical protein
VRKTEIYPRHNQVSETAILCLSAERGLSGQRLPRNKEYGLCNNMAYENMARGTFLSLPCKDEWSVLIVCMLVSHQVGKDEWSVLIVWMLVSHQVACVIGGWLPMGSDNVNQQFCVVEGTCMCDGPGH